MKVLLFLASLRLLVNSHVFNILSQDELHILYHSDFIPTVNQAEHLKWMWSLIFVFSPIFWKCTCNYNYASKYILQQRKATLSTARRKWLSWGYSPEVPTLPGLPLCHSDHGKYYLKCWNRKGYMVGHLL